MSLPTREDKQYDILLLIIDDLVKDDLDACYNQGPFQLAPPKRVAAVRCIQRLITHGQARLVDGTFPEDISSEMMEWYQALSLLFFGDKVMDDRFARDLDWDEDESKVYGWVEVDESKITLRINPYAHTDIFNFIGTFLHEMVHIFIYLTFEIEGPMSALPEDKRDELFNRLNGQSGHGYYFQKLARAVEDAARAVFDTDKIDLGRYASIVFEYQESDKVPSLEYFHELLINPRYENQPGVLTTWWDIKRRDNQRRKRNQEEAQES